MRSLYSNLISELRSERKRIDYQIEVLQNWERRLRANKGRYIVSPKHKNILRKRMKEVWAAAKKEEKSKQPKG
jgi:hypothetical protein